MTPTTTATTESAALSSALSRYKASNPLSFSHHQTATSHLPGGNTRTILHSSPFPIYISHGSGSTVHDEDGHTYTDLAGEYTAGLYGHSHPVILAAARKVLDSVGLSLCGTTVQERLHAELICQRYRLGMVRFANTGTEANLHALAAARRFTGGDGGGGRRTRRRRKVLVFGGGYHGSVLGFAGGGGGEPGENNVDPGDWVVGRYNDVEGTKKLFGELGQDMAAVLVEGMQGAAGCVRGTKEFLLTVQEEARRAGAVFVLDEVQTSRAHSGGLQRMMGLSPDLTTLGKWLGGGFSFGAFGGREEIMRVYDPRGWDGVEKGKGTAAPLSHSGTFNNNTMTMHVGYAGLKEVYTDEANLALNARGDKLRERLAEVSKGTKMSVTGLGAILAVHFSDAGTRGEEITCCDDIVERVDLKDLFWFEMLEEGFWITRRLSINLILVTPDEELDRFVQCVERFFERHKDIMVPSA